MIDFDNFSGISWLLGFTVAGLLFVFILTARRSIHGLFDPWFFTVFNQFIFLSLLSVLYSKNVLSFYDYAYWLVCTFIFFLPFVLIKCKEPNFFVSSSRVRTQARLVNLVIFFVSFYQITFDLFFIFSRGIPLLYESGSNPQIYLGGFGVIKYIHDACRYILPPLAVFSLFATGKRTILLFSIFVNLYPALLFEWSKSGFVIILMYYWVAAFYFFGRTTLLLKVTDFALSVAALFTLFMFSRLAATGYGENTLDSLTIRLVQTIDSAYFYFVMNAQAHIPTDFTFTGYIFSLVAPFFGVNISGSSIGQTLMLASGFSAEDGYGPSPPFQVIGHVFMKEYGILYALLLGVILALFKSRIGSLKPWQIIFYLMLYNVAPFLAGDVSILFYYLFITVFLLPPIILAVVISYCLVGVNDVRRYAS